ncbi:hypothetical protein ACTFIW_007535 [Dictyostelium discoideum]
MIERKDKFYREFLENNLFYASFVIGFDGSSIAYNKSPQIGESDAIIKGFKNIKKWKIIKIIGEEFLIYNIDNNKVYAQNEKHGCILIKTNKAYIIGIYPKKQEVSPRSVYLEKFCKQYDEEDLIKINEKEKFVF